ncbi:hypothetical protein R1flu_019129 [Riccia fluitans]|uniref:Serine hydrolase domain-containing protein n=1 Tax=Riccia fluitans TaxID=41844 RepID=A0ABD1ZHS6_9MARC
MGKLQQLLLVVTVALSLAVQAQGSYAEGEKLRVLVLHGYKGNGNRQCKYCNSWDPAVTNLIQFDCLTAPIPYIFMKWRDCYSWFNVAILYRSQSGIDESLVFILDHMLKNGPYDGVIGHSQGGFMAGVLVGVLEKKKEILGRSFGILPPLRFAIIDKGPFLEDLLEDVLIPPLKTKSFHVIGTIDPYQDEQEVFLTKWQDPQVEYIKMPHVPLTGEYMDVNFTLRFKEFLNNFRRVKAKGKLAEK